MESVRRALLVQGIAALGATLALGGRAARASRPEKLQLKIAPAAAPVALAEFIRQTGLQVLFDFDAVRHSSTRGVNGELDAQAALVIMFEGSGLTFEFINDRTVAVRPLPAVATPAAQTTALP
jgi:hypothetical protein